MAREDLFNSDHIAAAYADFIRGSRNNQQVEEKPETSGLLTPRKMMDRKNEDKKDPANVALEAFKIVQEKRRGLSKKEPSIYDAINNPDVMVETRGGKAVGKEMKKDLFKQAGLVREA